MLKSFLLAWACVLLVGCTGMAANRAPARPIPTSPALAEPALSETAPETTDIPEPTAVASPIPLIPTSSPIPQPCDRLRAVQDTAAYQQLPRTNLAAAVTVAHDAQGRTARPVPALAIPAGAEVRVLGRDQDGQWLLVVYGDRLGWVPTNYAQILAGRRDWPAITGSFSIPCVDLQSAALTLEDTWESPAAGDALLLAIAYRPEPEALREDISLTAEVKEGSGEVSDSETDHIALGSSGEIAVFTLPVGNLDAGSRVSFHLAGLEEEPFLFQAAFYSTSCSTSDARLALVPEQTNQQSESSLAAPPPALKVMLPTPTPIVVRSGLQEVDTAIGVIEPEDGLRVRSGPGTEYVRLGVLKQGTKVSILAYSTDSEGVIWWQVDSPEGLSGWVHSGYVDERGRLESVPEISRSAIPPTPIPPPTSTPAPPALASNRGNLLQGQNGWSYQYEQGRNSGEFVYFEHRQIYNGVDCYVSPREDFVRLCRDGELHPGQESRVAYRWDSSYSGPATIVVHAHKIDTRCGDGISIGVYAGIQGQPPHPLGVGDFSVGGSDNLGVTQNYATDLSLESYILVVVDIKGHAECDLSRVFIDLYPR